MGSQLDLFAPGEVAQVECGGIRHITIRQTWAMAILSRTLRDLDCFKNRECRNHEVFSKIGGETLGIHISQITPADYFAWSVELINLTLARLGQKVRFQDLEPLPHGHIVGTVFVVGVETTSHSPWFMDGELGRYGLILQDPKLLAKPIPCKGQLGLWRPAGPLQHGLELT